jgi:hypothetical protein
MAGTGVHTSVLAASLAKLSPLEFWAKTGAMPMQAAAVSTSLHFMLL